MDKKHNLKLFSNCLTASIFKNSLYGTCSNGGISEKWQEVVIAFVETEQEHLMIGEKAVPVVKIVRRNIGGEYVHLEPVAPGSYMAGGSFVYCCDSRFSENVNRYPVSLHDRQEYR